MVLLVKAHRDYYPQIPFLPWLHGSESCKHFFGIARQINPDFNFAELIQMLPKISQYTKALRNDKLNFDKERSVREGIYILHNTLKFYFINNNLIIENKFYLGYLFDYTSDQLDKLFLDKLRLWPNDEQISETIRHLHRLARDLAEYTGMIRPSNISIDMPIPQIIIEPYEIDTSNSGINEQSYDDDEESHDDSEKYDLSSAIKEASLEMKQITATEADDEEQEPNNDFAEGSLQLDEIAQPPENLYTLNGGDSSRFYLRFITFINLLFYL
jgi:hypothetical protein